MTLQARLDDLITGIGVEIKALKNKSPKQIVVDFGWGASIRKQATVTDAQVIPASKILAFVAPPLNADELDSEEDYLELKAIPDSVAGTFQLIASSSFQFGGKVRINYILG